jgi:hypothetical protein
MQAWWRGGDQREEGRPLYGAPAARGNSELPRARCASEQSGFRGLSQYHRTSNAERKTRAMGLFTRDTKTLDDLFVRAQV